jgi:hypothetical protein
VTLVTGRSRLVATHHPRTRMAIPQCGNPAGSRSLVTSCAGRGVSPSTWTQIANFAACTSIPSLTITAVWMAARP